MASELQTDYLPGQTVYFLLRNSVGQVWNGSSFESYQTANYATYPIAATEQGTASGYYTANFPSIAAGVYYAVAKARAGVSPAESDVSVGWGNIDWGGAAVTFLASGVVYLASGSVPPFTSSGIVQARLADGVVHGGSGATLRLGSSGAIASLYVTNDGGDAVKFEAVSGPLLVGHGLSLQGAGMSGGDGLRSLGGPMGDGFHAEGGTASGQATRGMHVQGASVGMSIEGATGAGLYVIGGGNGAYIVGGTGNAGLLTVGGLSGAGVDFRGTRAPGMVLRGDGLGQPGALFAGGASGAGAVFRGSGFPDVVGIVVSSGSLSGQYVNVFSGDVWVASGSIPSTNSGLHVIASLLSGQTTNVYSGQLSGQQVNLLSGNQVGVVSGTLFPASGSTWVASGAFTVASLLSGQLVNVSGLAQSVLTFNVSGIASGTIPVVSLGSVALKLASRFNARSGTTYLPDGTSVHMTQTPVNGSGMSPIGELGVGQQ